jgi:2-polyprenyl-3-methyl-5-hydroxy-6-metoxy-1,4-benzoquinol methylase
MTLNDDALNDLLGKFVADLGATVHAGNVVIGDRLGLYAGLAKHGPIDAAGLAAHTGTRARYVREWLAGQAAGGYVSADADAERFWLTEEQQLALVNPDGIGMAGAFLLAVACLQDEAKIAEAFRTGEGFGWHEHTSDVFVGTERFFRPGYVANLVDSWLPALDGVMDKLTAGATIADVGCGLGTSSRLMAQAFPASTVHGFDYHDESIHLAQKACAEAGLADRLQFEVAAADSFPGTDYDLVATFDCLHDMGDPVGAARHIRESLAPDGTWLLVEPFAGDAVAENMNPVGRVMYGFSTMLCVPHAISAGAGDAALGSQAGEPAIRSVAERAGFTRFRRAAETPFNIVYEVRS